MRQTNILGLALYDQTDKMNITGSENSLNHNMELIDEAIGQKVEESALNAAVESALAQAKENGDFNGDSGKSAYEIAVANGFNGTETEWLTSLNGNDGGFYTPIVTQPNEQMLHFAFNPSKEGMAEVAEVDVTLPKGTGGAVSDVEPSDGDMPKLFIDGEIPTSKTEVLATMRYVSKTDSFDAYLKIKCQGTSSMSYPKKNFTISMFSDEARTVKLKKGFKDWGFTSNKYVLKANYIDHSHARNICSAKLWGEVVTSRADYDTLPEQLQTSANNGAIDGFPVKLYTNGTYQGIYTWNIGKDAILWNMDKDNANHVLLCAETNTDGVYRETPCNFRALWNGVDEQDWSIEVGTNSDTLKNSLNALISCVKDTDDATFKATIGNYLDIQSAIDYYIHQYVIAGLDGLAKNMLLGTYDLKKWYCGAYDMDSTFGLWWTGASFVSAAFACPEDYQEQFSLLWERIETLYVDELKARYSELRKTVYSFSNICTVFERFTDTIGSELYAEDLTIYTGIPGGSTNNIKQIRDYARDRLTYCDKQFSAMSTPVSATGITLDQTAIEFTSLTPITLVATLVPENATDSVSWESSDTTVAIVNSLGVVRPTGNGECVIKATAGSVSATCAVTASGIEAEADLMYALDATTFDGTSGIDTGIKLFDAAKDFTILCDFSYPNDDSNGEHATVFHCINEISPWPGLSIMKKSLNTYRVCGSLTDIMLPTRTTNKVAITAKNGVISTVYNNANNSPITTQIATGTSYTKINQNLLLGCYQDTSGTLGRYFTGTINEFKVYNKVLDDAEIREWMIPTVPCEGISLSDESIILTGSEVKTLTATITPADCNEKVVWTSSNTEVARVNNGIVVPVGDGECTITATCGRYSAICSVVASDIIIPYTPLEYIESTGTQYIDTGVSGGTTSAYEIKFDPLNSQATVFEQYMAGDKSSAQAKLYFDSGNNALEGANNIYAEYYADGVKHNFKIFAPGSGTHVVKSSNNDFSVDDSAVVRNAYPKAGWGNTTVWVCNAHEEPTLFASMKLYYLKMWTDGELVRDFVPALYNGEVGLYDRVNGQFYSNAGTGAFIAGDAV